eukprot:TRINITY_DN6_c0_g1_i1.p2 TRINITY_DN6_c0_g1~~TRINITY_DN6_c0_g1_i1.p2  ORF type:complete len:184 (-),score=13.53 TRINITY_DN6_c0_g1_i1:24-575(-)
MPKIFSADQLQETKVTATISVVSTDSYDEQQIHDAIHANDINECFAVALQFALVGMGKQTYGSVVIDGETKKVADLCAKNHVLTGNGVDAKLNPSDLTIRRLARYFRFHIRDYVENEEAVSFLYRKYSNGVGQPQFTFPCAEYMVEEGQTEGILESYAALDKERNTNFLMRVKVILRTRHIDF